jgi:acetyl-CoA carboxylase biotin carboxyl carrier protein
VLKIGEIRELIRLLDETQLCELRIETDDMKLLLKKPEPKAAEASPCATPAAVAPAIASTAPVPAAPVQASPVAPQAPARQEAAVAETPQAAQTTAEDTANYHIIKSPMVGTFYRAPAPDAPPYVEVGSKVNEKTVVCIVEAMKLMNEIEAEVSGEVVEVLAENGQLVEYGQPLFKIKLA